MARLMNFPPALFLLRLAVKATVARHRAGVSMVCVDDAGQILMLRHVFHPSTPWDLPGGWLEREESPADCAVRELREETGLAADLGPLVAIRRIDPPDHLVITYLARLSSEASEPVLSTEVLEASWFSPEELPNQLRPSTRLAIEAAMELLPNWLEMEQDFDV